MANIKIQQLAAKTTPKNTDVMVIEDATSTKKITFEAIKEAIKNEVKKLYKQPVASILNVTFAQGVATITAETLGVDNVLNYSWSAILVYYSSGSMGGLVIQPTSQNRINVYARAFGDGSQINGDRVIHLIGFRVYNL